jgi:hypothetical protein
MEPGERDVRTPADSGRCSNPTTEEIETFFADGADACVGIDMPGVGLVPATVAGRPYVVGDMPIALRTKLDEEERDTLISKLIFAARDLAQSGMRRRPWGEHCTECGATEKPVSGSIRHASICETGRVLDLIEKLKALNARRTPDPAAIAQADGAADPEAPENLYGEPWRFSVSDLDEVRVFDSEGALVANIPSASRREALEWAERICAAVNFCSGISEPALALAEPLAARYPGLAGFVGGAL